MFLIRGTRRAAGARPKHSLNNTGKKGGGGARAGEACPRSDLGACLDPRPTTDPPSVCWSLVVALPPASVGGWSSVVGRSTGEFGRPTRNVAGRSETSPKKPTTNDRLPKICRLHAPAAETTYDQRPRHDLVRWSSVSCVGRWSKVKNLPVAAAPMCALAKINAHRTQRDARCDNCLPM